MACAHFWISSYHSGRDEAVSRRDLVHRALGGGPFDRERRDQHGAPGRVTRRSSLSPPMGSGRWFTTNAATTTSNPPLRNGRR